jgi:biotin carboxylase
VGSSDEVEEAVKIALDASRSATLLVEELVPGREVTVNAFSSGGHFHPLTVTDRLTAALPAFGVALTHAWPSELEPAQIGAVVEAASAAARAVGIENGPSYTQVLVGPDGPRVGELAARLGGGHDAELCRVALGVDLNGAALSAALGEEVPPASLAPVAKVGGACVRFLVAPPGELREVTGVQEAFALEGIRGIRIYRRPGHRFGGFRRGADRAGAVLAVGDSPEEALDRAAQAEATIQFEVDVEALV